MLDTPHAPLDPLLELERLVDELPAAQQRARLGDQLDRVGTWLQQRAEQIASFTAIIEACGDLGRAASTIDRGAVRGNLAEAAAFGEDAANAADAAALGAVRDMCGDAIANMTQCQSTLRRVARDLVTREFLPLRATGNLLRELDPHSTLGSRLVDFADRVMTIETCAPVDFAGRIHDALAEGTAFRIEIEAVAHEPDQKRFLAALVAGTATLADITPTILHWLGEAGGLDRFAVLPQSQVR